MKPRASWIWRALRWIGIFLVGLVALVALWLAAENVTGRIALGRWDREMRARGEKPTLVDLKLPPAGPKEQRRCALIEAMEALTPFNDSCKLAAGGLPTQKFVVPGKAMVLLRQPEPIDPLVALENSRLAKEPHAWADLSAQVDRARAPLEALRVAAAEGRWDANLDYPRGVTGLNYQHLGPVRNMARWLSSAAVRDLHEGGRDAAVENLVAMAHLGRALREEPILISQLVRLAVDNIGMGATWPALQTDGWSDAQLERLQHAWQQAGAIGDIPRTFEGERALGRIGMARLRDGRDPVTAPPPLDGGMETRPGRGLLERISGYCTGMLWRRIFLWGEEYEYCRMIQANIEMAREAIREGAWAPLKGQMTDCERRESNASFLERCRCSMAWGLAPALSRTMLSFFRHETQREMTVAAIALERFKLRHGSYPARLDELVPEFLPAAPRDFMDGKTLRYRKNADGTFALWSVGENLVDDGGDPRPLKEGGSLRWWECKDLVWPQPATAEEIAAAIAKEKPARPEGGRRKQSL